MTITKVRTFMIENGLLYAVGLAIVIGLKYYYSRASGDSLGWILIPTARLVEYISGIHFERELYAGLVNYTHQITIAPSCAGINFLIIVFSTLFFSITYRFSRKCHKLLWLGISAGIAYILTLGVNTFRIVVAIYLYKADIYGGWVTPERIHRIGGTFIYFFFLLIVYLIAERIIKQIYYKKLEEGKNLILEGKKFFHMVCSCLVPFFWYFLIALGIPLFNMIFKQDRTKFPEHFFLVISVCIGVFCLLFLMLFGYHKISRSLGQLKRK